LFKVGISREAAEPVALLEARLLGGKKVMFRTSRSVITLIALFILLALPLAVGARGLETSRPVPVAGEGWLGTAFDWLQEAFGLRSREHRHQGTGSPAGFQAKEDPIGGGSVGGSSTSGGSCIDPQGNRYPPPCAIF
jgi:hypothetical protein